MSGASSHVSSPAGRSTGQQLVNRILLIAGFAIWVYYPAINGVWFGDDAIYIFDNPLLHSVSGLWKFWFQPGSWVEYYPVEETVLWVEYQLWHIDPVGYHLVNLVLHLVNALLVWRLLDKFGLRLAWLGGLIFAVHPMQVETVVSAAELKNTLSTPFFLLSMCSWIDFDEHRRKGDYIGAVVLYLFGMLCKISFAPYPAVILLYAWWKRGRVLWSDVKFSLLPILISLEMVFTTVLLGELYAARSFDDVFAPLGGVLHRFVGAGLIFSFYFSRCFLPLAPVVTHAKWNVDPHAPLQYLTWLAFGLFAGWCWMNRRGWGRHILLGLVFFALCLLPFLGFHYISYMYYTWILEHMLYLPIIGLIGITVAGLGDLDAKVSQTGSVCVQGVAALAVFLLACESHGYAKTFAANTNFWEYILRQNPDSITARADCGDYLLRRGDYAGAIAQYQVALELNPDFSAGRSKLAKVYGMLGRTADQERELRMHLRYSPHDISSYLDLADLLKKQGRTAEVVACYQDAIRQSPDLAQLRYNLGSILLASGNLPGAVVELGNAVKLDPTIDSAHENYGVALARSMRIPEAIEQFRKALAISPGIARTHDDLALALVQAGRIPEAIEEYQKALALDPDDAIAKTNLERLRISQLPIQPAGKK